MRKRIECTPPAELWTCRDWYIGEPTHVRKQSFADFECAQCPDSDECKGPVKYFRAPEE